MAELSPSRLILCVLVASQVFTAPARAQTLPPAVRVAGAGPLTYVLLSGMVGGVASFQRLETRLVSGGNRVVIIDPYQLAIDSTAVSFDALARIVDAELLNRGITAAVLVGHSHGGGVALRLAANSPRRVAALYLLDVGALPSNRGAVFSSAIRLVPIIARIPTGKMFIRHKLAEGLRENSATQAWLDHQSCRAYTEPLIDNVDRVVAMAMRLSKADEPEPVDDVVRRIVAPITVVLGGVRTKAGPNDAELRALDQLGARVRIETIAGAGHFPHEETPDAVVRIIGRPFGVATSQP